MKLLVENFRRNIRSLNQYYHRSLITAIPQHADSIDELNLHLAPSAIQRLKELQKESPNSVLRVTVEGGGCSGFQYKFSLDERKQQDDMCFESEGAKILCDQLSYQYLKGSTIEFSDSLMRSSFQIKENPNSEASCGCGASFAVKETD